MKAARHCRYAELSESELTGFFFPGSEPSVFGCPSMVPLCTSMTQHCLVKVGSPSWGSGSIYLRLEDILCVLFVSLFG